MQQRPPLALWLPLLLLLTAAAFLLSLAVGSAPIPLSGLWAALTGGGDSMSHTVVMQLRLPRTINAFAVGGLLALAGTLMQVLLRNPLADPYILGVSGGAAVGALGALLLGLAGLWVNGGAFVGALVSTLIVFPRPRTRRLDADATAAHRHRRGRRLGRSHQPDTGAR